MSSDDFILLATVDRQIRVTTGAPAILASPIWPCQTTARCSWCSVFAAAAAAVTLIAIKPIGATATDGQSTSSRAVHLVCDSAHRESFFNASGSWQEVIVNGSNKNFTNNCAVYVTFASSITTVSSAYPNWQTAVLVKVYELQLRPAGSKCKYNNVTLRIYSLLNNTLNEGICDENALDAEYIWVSETIQLNLYVWPSTDIRVSFSVSFVAVQPIDICQNSSIQSESLSEHQELYVFAPDSAFTKFLQNSTACFSSKQLRLAAAASPANVLSVTVLAAPTNSSCWSLWLDEIPISSASRSLVLGANVIVRYLHNDSRSSCKSNEVQRGFTLKFTAVAAVIVASTSEFTTIPATAATSISAVQSTSTTIPGGTEVTSTSETVAAVAATTSSSEFTAISAIASRSIMTVQPILTTLPAGSKFKNTTEAVTIGSAVAAVLVVTGVVLAVALIFIRRRRRLIQRPHNSSYRATSSVLGLADSVAARHVNHSNNPYAVPSGHPRSQHEAIFSASTDAAARTDGGRSADLMMVDNDLYGTAFGS